MVTVKDALRKLLRLRYKFVAGETGYSRVLQISYDGGETWEDVKVDIEIERSGASD